MSLNDKLPRVLLGLALCWPFLTWSAEQVMRCPATLESKNTATAPPGWQLIDSSDPYPLERVGFYSGHPSEQASLVPDKTQNKKGESRDIWQFSNAAPERTWMACFYAGTASFLAQAIARDTTRCEVRYRMTRNNNRLSLTDIRCLQSQSSTP